jgi:hypothetical protein
MNVLRHQNKSMQVLPTLAPMPIEGSQKNSNAGFDHEQSSALPRAKGHEVSSRRRNGSYGLQSKPQRLKAATTFQTESARVKLVPFPVDFFAGDFFSGRDA